jgi:hypothetical protein
MRREMSRAVPAMIEEEKEGIGNMVRKDYAGLESERNGRTVDGVHVEAEEGKYH